MQNKPTTTRRPSAELLETPGALLTRTDLRELGLHRGATTPSSARSTS